MCNEHELVHAGAFHMAVVIAPLAEAVARIPGAELEVTSIQRIA